MGGSKSERASGRRRAPAAERLARDVGAPSVPDGILALIHDGVISTDTNGVVLTWNPAAERIYGYAEAEAVGRHVSFLRFPEDADAWADQVLAPTLAKGMHELTLRNRRKDGEEIYVALRLVVQRDADGQPIALIGCANDVTERTRVAQALRRQREEQQTIFDAMPAMVWYKDRHNRILRANRAAAESIHRTTAELEGASTYDLFPEEAAKYHRDDLEVIRSGVPKLGIVEQLDTGAGAKRWVRTDKIPYRDEHGEIIGVIVFAVDLTELKQAEAALARSRDDLEQRVRERTAELSTAVDSLRSEIAERQQVEERLEVALWASDLGLWDWDTTTNRVIYGRRWAEMLGYAPEEIVPDLAAWQRIVHPDDLPAVRQALEGMLGYAPEEIVPDLGVRQDTAPPDDLPVARQQSEVRLGARQPHGEVEQRLRTKDGQYRWILTRGKVVEWGPDGRARRIAGTNRDITVRKQIEERMRVQQAELAHVLRLQTVEGVAAELAHEINQPLGAIANYANGLVKRLRHGEIDRDALVGVADQIGRQALRAGQVLQRLREFTRKGAPEHVPCDLNRLIVNAAELIEPELRRQRIALRLALHTPLPEVAGDGVQLEQVILNLLRNGAEAIAASGGARREVAIETRIGVAGAVEVVVSDTGGGIDPAAQERLFEPFFTTKKGGLGMGLSISRSIIEAHGGRLWAEPGAGRGAIFAFSLPAA